MPPKTNFIFIHEVSTCEIFRIVCGRGRKTSRFRQDMMVAQTVCDLYMLKKGNYLGFKQTGYSRLPCAGSIPVGWPRIVRSFMIV